jgi:thiol-disulfide isomerase/thioredoxin
MKRRWLFGGAALASLGAGIGVRQWQTQRIGNAEPSIAGDFWGMSFPTVEGRPLPMSAFRGRPLLLNFWATWCPPCIKEMPEIDRFFRAQGPQGWQVLGLAVDKAGPVQAFLARNPVAYPIALAGFDGVEVSIALGNAGSGLPFTVAFGRDGAVARRKAGETNEAELSSWAREIQ